MTGNIIAPGGGGGDVSLGVNIVLYEMKHLRALL